MLAAVLEVEPHLLLGREHRLDAHGLGRGRDRHGRRRGADGEDLENDSIQGGLPP